jgi:hypothetical protein
VVGEWELGIWEAVDLDMGSDQNHPPLVQIIEPGVPGPEVGGTPPDSPPEFPAMEHDLTPIAADFLAAALMPIP